MAHANHERPTIPPAEELAKLPPDGGPEWNRLVFQKSPYLQQHAANPVDWYPWGEEAFEKARTEDKPVFLSVGYSTCHWCHVMERESFESDEIGELMNEAFVCIKVDREERPDIDQVYMTVTQAMTGSGGWPMTVLLTPDKKPFFAGTYFPPDSRYGRPGMRELVPHIQKLWKTDRKRLLDTANYVSAELAKIVGGAPGDALNLQTLEKAFEDFRDRFDGMRAGFGDRPKFPVPHNLSFLLRYARRADSSDAQMMAEKTLQRMRLGGIFDHVGFGFHRYSTDANWLLPHFEKMLYDQALLVTAYCDAYAKTKTPMYRQVAEEILTYVLRDLTSPEGGFYSAEDADSEGEEGKFYVWSLQEVLDVLGREDGTLFAKLYNFDREGNFYEEATGEQTGANIPHLRRELDHAIKQMNLDVEATLPRIEAARQTLFAHREKRIHPFKDDKILTDWNGLMIAAAARAGVLFGEERYLQAAKRAADFCLTTLRTKEGRLLKRYRHGEAGLPAHLEDYAFLIHGLVELYQATFHLPYLKDAVELCDDMIAHFYDSEGFGFFHTADDGEELLVRTKDVYDGAIPSGNSVAALSLLKLARLTGRTEYEERARETFQAFSGQIERSPSQFAQMLVAVDFAEGPGAEVVLAGDPESAELKAMAKAVHERFLPNTVVLQVPTMGAEEHVRLIPSLEGMKPREGRATAYVCRNFACEAPTTELAELAKKLDS